MIATGFMIVGHRGPWSWTVWDHESQPSGLVSGHGHRRRSKDGRDCDEMFVSRALSKQICEANSKT
jgi:hypothetical protein